MDARQEIGGHADITVPDVIEGDLADLARLGLRSVATQPDVALVELADRRRLASLRLPAENAHIPALVVLADDLTRNELLRALNGGVRAVLARNASSAEVFAAIEAAAAGLFTIDPADLEILIPAANAVDDEPALEALSAREAEVLALMAEGLANKEIADRLHISEHTVKFHVSSILAKLGAASRTEAVTRGVKDGLLLI